MQSASVSFTAVTADNDTSHQDLVAWLQAFADAIRAVDYEAGMRLFAPYVVGFGTVGVMLNGLPTLVCAQWQKVWGVTRGFEFHLDRLCCHKSGDMAWIAVPWTSIGQDASGNDFQRNGRATYVLQHIDGQWLAVHSHHSLNPSSVPTVI